MNFDLAVVMISVADILPWPGKNLSPYYSAMLMTKALTSLLRAWDTGKYSQLPHLLLQRKVLPTLFDCLVRTIQSQCLDGSWGCRGPREETSYAILNLASLFSLPFSEALYTEIRSAIDRGRFFLQASTSWKAEYLWIEKVSFGCSRLAEVYTIAAMHTVIDLPTAGPRVRDLCRSDSEEKEFDFQYARNLSSGDMDYSRMVVPQKFRPCHAVLAKNISTCI